MNISIINYEYPPIGGGAATFTKYLAHNLALRGHRVSVLTSKFNNNSSCDKINNLKVFRVRSYRKSIYEASIKGMISFITSGFLYIDKFFQTVKPDICINFFAIPCGPLALYMKKKYKVPYILCLRGGDVPGFSPQETNFYHKILKGINRTIWDESLEITANSKGLRNLAYKFHDNKKINVIYNGVDTEFFKPRSNDKIGMNNEFNILFVGRLAYQKNIINFIDKIYRKLNTDGLNVNLNIAGDGPLKKKIIEHSKSIDDKKINFYGWLKREELPFIYNSNDLLVLPSLYEGMSNVVLEAKACNLPVVAFNIAGNEEMLEQGKDYIIEKNNYNQMKLTIEKLIKMQSYKKISITDNFYSKFCMNNITDQYIEMLLNNYLV